MGKIWVELWLFAASRSCRNCASDRGASTGDFAQSTWNEKPADCQTASGETWTQSLLHLATKLKMDHRKGRSSTCNLNMTQENCTYDHLCIYLRKNVFGGICRITKAGACSRLLRSFLPAVDIDPPKIDRQDVANLKKHIGWTVSFSPIKSCHTNHLVHHSMYIYIILYTHIIKQYKTL